MIIFNKSVTYDLRFNDDLFDDSYNPPIKVAHSGQTYITGLTPDQIRKALERPQMVMGHGSYFYFNKSSLIIERVVIQETRQYVYSLDELTFYENIHDPKDTTNPVTDR